MRDGELTKLLGWPGYRVYRHEINERASVGKQIVAAKSGHHVPLDEPGVVASAIREILQTVRH